LCFYHNSNRQELSGNAYSGYGPARTVSGIVGGEPKSPTPGAAFAALLRFVYANNPFYLISAALVLYGFHLSFNPEIDPYDPFSHSPQLLFTGLVGFTLLMAGACVLLVRLGTVWDDARQQVWPRGLRWIVLGALAFLAAFLISAIKAGWLPKSIQSLRLRAQGLLGAGGAGGGTMQTGSDGPSNPSAAITL
jgi:hypothetical protein